MENEIEFYTNSVYYYKIMSSDGLSELFTFTPKKIPPFTEIKSGFKYYPIEPTANGKLRIRLFLYDETQQDASELHLVITQEVYDTYHHSIHGYLVAKLGLGAMYVEPVPVPVQEPVQETVQETVQEPVQEPVQETVQEPVQETVQEPCLLYTSPSPRDRTRSRMPSSA